MAKYTSKEYMIYRKIAWDRMISAILSEYARQRKTLINDGKKTIHEFLSDSYLFLIADRVLTNHESDKSDDEQIHNAVAGFIGSQLSIAARPCLRFGDVLEKLRADALFASAKRDEEIWVSMMSKDDCGYDEQNNYNDVPEVFEVTINGKMYSNYLTGEQAQRIINSLILLGDDSL